MILIPCNGCSIDIRMVCKILVLVCTLIDAKIYGQVPHYFKKNVKYVYSSYYINENNDTLSVEKIGIQNSGEHYEKDTNQLLAVYSYSSKVIDTNLFYPTEHKLPIKWVVNAKEGIIDNDDMFWMHPFRMNQYYLTEIAPSPMHYYNGIVKRSKLKIKGWGDFEGILKEKYIFLGSKDIDIEGRRYDGCEKIYSIGRHRKGKSTNTFYFHRSYGFVKMDYKFFNKHRIVFNLHEIIEVN